MADSHDLTDQDKKDAIKEAITPKWNMHEGKWSSLHWLDVTGNPDGGITEGVGVTISWQRGPLVKKDGVGNTHVVQPNGAFVETILQMAMDRLKFYQTTKFECEENDSAIMYIEDAIKCIQIRATKRTEAKKVGTHEV